MGHFCVQEHKKRTVLDKRSKVQKCTLTFILVNDVMTTLKRCVKFLSLIFILKCLSKFNFIQLNRRLIGLFSEIFFDNDISLIIWLRFGTLQFLPPSNSFHTDSQCQESSLVPWTRAVIFWAVVMIIISWTVFNIAWVRKVWFIQFVSLHCQSSLRKQVNQQKGVMSAQVKRCLQHCSIACEDTKVLSFLCLLSSSIIPCGSFTCVYVSWRFELVISGFVKKLRHRDKN